MKIKYSNNAATVLNAPVEVGHTVLIVASGSKFPILTAGDWMYVTVEEEVVKVTNTSGNVFTCEAFNQAHGTGSSVENRVTTEVMDNLQDVDIYDTPSDKPSDGTMRHGEMWGNSTDKRFGIGDQSGNPIELVAVRLHSSAAKYYVDDVVVYQGGLWKCILEHTGSVFDGSMWESAGGGSGGGLAWELSSSGAVSAVGGAGYQVYTATEARTVNLEVGEVGKTIGICDVSRNCGTNTITVVSSGSEKIMGLVENFEMDIDGMTVILAFSDAINGWVVVGGNW